eukprot:TRINITY_DN13826_c0_g1_i6.p1 TRINITY_DN13826_c0_g1~~TRINITY_DN13826_c0_g1_i6.p1  ORF type:complete len:567 (+),score=83.20 TRINITY_DN13826_c0_g1_i6:61-1761(+)
MVAEAMYQRQPTLETQTSTLSVQSSASARSTARRSTWPAKKCCFVTEAQLSRRQKRYKSCGAKDDLAALMSQQASEHSGESPQPEASTPKKWMRTPRKVPTCIAFSRSGVDLEAGLQYLAEKKENIIQSKQGQTKMTKREASAMMANLLIGVGMLSLPYGFREAGFVLGLIMLCGSMVVMMFTALLVGSSLTKAKAMLAAKGGSVTELDLATLGQLAYGPVGRIVIAVLVVGELWFSFLTFSILQADNLQLLFGTEHMHGTIMRLLCSFACILCPPKALSLISSVSVLAIFMGIVALLISGFALLGTDTPPFDTYHTYVRPEGAGTMLGLAMFSYSGHAEIAYIYTQMANPEADFRAAVKSAMLVAGSFYLCVGTAGYCFFGDHVMQSFTGNLGQDLSGEAIPGLWYLRGLTVACFVVKLQGSTPVIIAPVLQVLYKPFMSAEEIDQGGARKRRICIVLTLLVSSCVTATMLHESVALATALTGDVFTIGLSVVVPPLVALRVSSEKQTPAYKRILMAVSLAGLICAVAGFGHVVSEMLAHQDASEISKQLILDCADDSCGNSTRL